MNTKATSKKVQAYIQKYANFDETDTAVAAGYAMTTWMYKRFQAVKYLQIVGNLGIGKSVSLKTIGNVCFNPMFSYGHESHSALMHLVNHANQRGGGTLCVDDVFNIKTKDDDLTTFGTLLICGAQVQSRYVLRGAEDSGIDRFDVFCPKVLVQSDRYMDPRVEARCIKVGLVQRDFITPQAGVDLYQEIEDASMVVAGVIAKWAESIGTTKKAHFRFEDMVSMCAGVDVRRGK